MKLRNVLAGMREHDWQHACVLLNEVVAKYPTAAHLYTMRSMCLYHLKHYQQSFTNARQVGFPLRDCRAWLHAAEKNARYTVE